MNHRPSPWPPMAAVALLLTVACWCWAPKIVPLPRAIRKTNGAPNAVYHHICNIYLMNTEFDETRAEEKLANYRVELPPGELERIVIGTPNIVWDTLAFCAKGKLVTAVERIWAGCQECIEDGEADLAIELGQALVYGLRRRSEREQKPQT